MTNNELHSVQINVSPTQLPSFMVNWVISYKCNLDCSYCVNHDNLVNPIPLDQCKRSIEFIFKYVDLLFSVKQKHEKIASINIIGGEPFTHPNFLEILEYAHSLYKENYQDRWKLSICITTNGLAGNNLLKKCLPYIDKWTVSYHTETLPKQKKLILKNIRTLHKVNKYFEVRVMAPGNKEKFEEAQHVHSTLISEGVNALMKPINYVKYDNKESNYFKIFWKDKNKDKITNYSTEKGITCCSERPLVINGDRKSKTNFISNSNFEGWYCALNWNFLSVDQNQRVYHNTSCFVSYNTNKEEPIGTIDNYEAILDDLKSNLDSRSVPVIKCPKSLCHGCGMCATKASTKEEFKELMKFHLADTSILDFGERAGR